MSYYFAAEAVARCKQSLRDDSVATGATITFERDGSGKVVGLVLDQAGNQTRATKK